jgi:alpha,alpha-trehalase
VKADPSITASGTGARCDEVVIDARLHDAVIFDLDGVVTDTATVHARTWTQLFDAFLVRRGPRPGEDHSPFSADDYRRYVDGKCRTDGIQDFLASRNIELAAGERAGTDIDDTVRGLANLKQRLFQEQLLNGVSAFDSTVALVHRLGAAGFGTAIYSSSRNCRSVLRAAGLDGLFQIQVDGREAEKLGLKGKPDPALLLETTKRLGVRPARCVVVEDARAGVIAGRNGGFAMVIALGARDRHADLLACGADAAVTDLAQVTVSGTLPRSP